jgi:hypothetical protein
MASFSNTEFHYSFGMNTQEKDDEIYGAGNSYSAEYWQYDARLGRRWNVDPLCFTSIGSYSVFINNPVMFLDTEGDIIKFSKKASLSFKIKTTIITSVLRITSPTFREIYKNLKKSPFIHTIHSVDATSFFSGLVYPNYIDRDFEALQNEQSEIFGRMLSLEIDGAKDSEEYKRLEARSNELNIDIRNYDKPKPTEDGTGSGSDIYFSFKRARKRAEEKGGGKRGSGLKLVGHEFSHANEVNSGTVIKGEEIDTYSYMINEDGSVDIIAKFVPYEEKRAHNEENKIIKEVNRFVPRGAKINKSSSYDPPDPVLDKRTKT